jgi:xanthine dehydrogenase molybdenum-binding subunit
MATKVDVLRSVTDASYAANLTPEDWNALSRDPLFRDLAAEVPELTAPLFARFGLEVGGSGSPVLNPSLATTEFSVVGKRIPRTQGIGVVTGIGRFTENMTMPGMVFMKTLGSSQPHAKIKSIDTSKAEKLPGVIKILHRGNMPKEYVDVAMEAGPPTRFIFGEEVYQVGAPVAAVAAVSDHVADEAIRLIEVQYEVLPAVFDMLEAIKASTPKQWDNKLDGTTLGVLQPFVRGSGDAGLSLGDVVVENVASKPFENHVALELSNSLTWWNNNKLVHIGTVRHPAGRRDRMSQWLSVPQSDVRVINPGYIGSSYGSMRDPDWHDIISAIMSKIIGLPVKTVATRSEDFVIRTHRAQTRTEGKLAVKRDGTMVAATFKVVSNNGAFRAAAASGGWITYQQLYNIPNLRLEAIDAFTNMYRYGSFRCVQHPAATFAQETLVDRAAFAINMNPLDIRLKNINEVGDPDTKVPYSNPGLRACIEKAAETIGWKDKWHAPKTKEIRPGVFHGIGIAAHTCSHGAGGAPSTAMVVINGDGTLTVVSGAAEVGAGERTIMAMIGSEVLSIPYSQTGITPDVDSDFTADTGNTAGSRQTISGGWGVYEAAMDARNQMLDWAAKKFVADAKRATPPETLSLKVTDLDVTAGTIFVKADPTRKMLVRDAVTAANNPIIGRGAHIHETTWQRLAFASHAAEVEVDTITGSIKILKYVAAHDVGRAINPMGVEQQIEGGVIMGIGAALLEENIVDASTGLPLNDNILEYKTLTIKDIPRTIDIVLVEYNKGYGLWGAHGIGEPPIALPAPVISNAVFNAVGVRLESAPMTRVKLLAALKTA